ncbi:PKD domain-containing protein, partial [Klebsiella pneumoniae]|uniref:PKD domain-containing protein n=1 Tax=Klebsiella pneumoniae TaxID=573 RepID=UPI003FD15B30
SLVQLDGSGSQSSAGSFSCSWSQVRGQSLVLQNANQCLASFIAPDVAGTSEIELRLTVTDSASRQTAQHRIDHRNNDGVCGLPR